MTATTTLWLPVEMFQASGGIDLRQAPQVAELRIVRGLHRSGSGATAVLLEAGHVSVAGRASSPRVPSDAPELRTSTLPDQAEPAMDLEVDAAAGQQTRRVCATELMPPSEAVLNCTIQS